MSAQLKGLILTTLGVLFVVPDSLYVRLIEADPMVVVFWRGLTSGGIVLLFVLLSGQARAFGPVLRGGAPVWAYVTLIGMTTVGFVMAVTNTSVANVVFIFATTPVFAALFSRVFLSEPISRRMVLTMAVVMGGLGIIAYGSGETQAAHWSGDLWALAVAAAYAAALTAVRKLRDIAMIPAIPIAYIGAALVVLPFVAPWGAFAEQWHLILGHGAFIGVATCFLTLGPRYISSAEVSLLILLESVLAPILVWAWIGEEPGRWAVVGGVVVIGALVVSNLVALRRARVGV